MAGLRSSIDYLKQQKRNLKRRRKLRQADVVIVSHAKSGRTWLCTMISHLYHQKYGIEHSKLIRMDNFHLINPEIPKIFVTHDSRKTRSWRPLADVAQYASKKVILLVRDPRDVVVSAYFHFTRRHRHADDMPLMLYAFQEQLPRLVDFMNKWADTITEIPCSMIVRYEDLHCRPHQELAKVANFIGGNFSDAMIGQAVEFASYDNLRELERQRFFNSSRLHPGDSADPESFKVRRAQVGGYRNHFSDDDLAAVEQFLGNDLLARFGYRRDT
jgi:Sulfotransferase domain